MESSRGTAPSALMSQTGDHTLDISHDSNQTFPNLLSSYCHHIVTLILKGFGIYGETLSKAISAHEKTE